MNKHYGKCALCGGIGKLTFEHIPPKSAFNSRPVRPVSGLDLLAKKTINDEKRMPWDTMGLKYENQQQGMGRYSLCANCNNNTGAWYGDAYTYFANVAHAAISNYSSNDPDGICFEEIYPLRFIKQVLSMFCSSSGPDNPSLDSIRDFVLDKEAVGLDKNKYKLCMYFTKTTVMRQTGYMVVTKSSRTGFETMALSEITAYPFGFILYFHPTETWDYKGTDITELADCGFNDVASIHMPWRIEEMNDVFPESYRSKEEIRAAMEKR